MAHKDQMAFVSRVKARFPHYFTDQRVLEVGSYNVNGSVRQFFSKSCEYVGLDLNSGPDVDVVCAAHNYDAPPGSFGTVISCEALEHDRHARLTCRAMMELLRPKGLIVITCAGEGRPSHCDFPQAEPFYRNVRCGDLLEWLIGDLMLKEAFSEFGMEARFIHPEDLYLWAIKAGS